MVATIFSYLVSTGLITGIAVAGTLVFSVLMVLSEDHRHTTLMQINRSLTGFTLPLLILFGYIFILYCAKILVS